MITVKSLVVANRSHHSSVSYLLEHVNVHVALFLSSLLVVEADTWGIIVVVGRDDRLNPIDKEEWHVP